MIYPTKLELLLLKAKANESFHLFSLNKKDQAKALLNKNSDDYIQKLAGLNPKEMKELMENDLYDGKRYKPVSNPIKLDQENVTSQELQSLCQDIIKKAQD